MINPAFDLRETCWIILTNVCYGLRDVISILPPQGGLGPHTFLLEIINETNIRDIIIYYFTAFMFRLSPTLSIIM